MPAGKRRHTPRLDALFLPMLALACLVGCAMRAGPGQPPLVGDVSIRGNKAVPTGDIVSKLALAKSGFQFIFKVGEPIQFDPDLVRVDRLRVERIYRAFGYYQARVVDILTKDDRGRVNITFVVTEGLPTHVTHLQIDGVSDLPTDVQQFLLRNLPLSKDGVFSEGQYDDTKEALKTRLKSFGYWDVADDGHVLLDPTQRTAEVTVTVEPGVRYRLGSVVVTGSKDISLDRIKAASGLHAGDYISPRMVADAQHRVQALGVFSQTLVRPQNFDAEHATADVDINVIDAPFQQVDAGVGLEADQTRQLGRLRGVYTHKNLGINLERIVAGGSIGYAFLPTVWSFLTTPNGQHGTIADLSFAYIQPRVLLFPVDARAAITYSKDLTPAYAFQRVGAEVGALFYIEPVRGLTFTPSLHYDYYFDASSGPPQPTIPGAPPSSFATSGCGPDLSGVVTSTCSIAWVEGRVAYDARDDPLTPRRGAYLGLGVQYATPLVSDFNYVRLNPEARFYVPMPFFKEITIAGRLNYGELLQLGGRQPPGVARFFSGGANSVRVASALQLGPRSYVVLPNTDKKSSQPFIAGAPVPVGGDHLFEGSAEFRWHTPLSGLTVAAFFDAGILTLQENNPVPNTSGGFQFGPGIGFRYHTPFGPLRLDFAYRISGLYSFPVSVDTTNITDPVAHGVPTTVLTASGTPNYTIATTCRLLPGQQPYQCYQDNSFQFFLVLGEPF